MYSPIYRGNSTHHEFHGWFVKFSKGREGAELLKRRESPRVAQVEIGGICSHAPQSLPAIHLIFVIEHHCVYVPRCKNTDIHKVTMHFIILHLINPTQISYSFQKSMEIQTA